MILYYKGKFRDLTEWLKEFAPEPDTNTIIGVSTGDLFCPIGYTFKTAKAMKEVEDDFRSGGFTVHSQHAPKKQKEVAPEDADGDTED